MLSVFLPDPILVNGWPNGFAFIMSFLAPLWTICKSIVLSEGDFADGNASGSFDSSVHIAEESSNASVAVPWGIVNAISVAGILGWGKHLVFLTVCLDRITVLMAATFCYYVAINMVLAFCMGSDLEALWDSDQPMALIFLNSFGRHATLGLWVVVCLVQYMMGSSMVS